MSDVKLGCELEQMWIKGWLLGEALRGDQRQGETPQYIVFGRVDWQSQHFAWDVIEVKNLSAIVLAWIERAKLI